MVLLCIICVCICYIRIYVHEPRSIDPWLVVSPLNSFLGSIAFDPSHLVGFQHVSCAGQGPLDLADAEAVAPGTARNAKQLHGWFSFWLPSESERGWRVVCIIIFCGVPFCLRFLRGKPKGKPPMEGSPNKDTRPNDPSHFGLPGIGCLAPVKGQGWQLTHCIRAVSLANGERLEGRVLL